MSFSLRKPKLFIVRILLASSSPTLKQLIRRGFSRFHYEWALAEHGVDAFHKIMTRKFDLLILDYNLPRMKAPEILSRIASSEKAHLPPSIVLTGTDEERFRIEKAHCPKTEILSKPFSMRNFVGLVRQTLHQSIQIACLGGGTGLFTLLSGLKTISGVSLSSIVSMSDDGGSTGKLRDMFGILPPGDIRRSLVALSTAPDLLNDLIQYRFDRGGELRGHTLGNLLLTALSTMRGSMALAVKSIGEILNIQGHVIPVTETVNTLKAELENGSVIEGEHRIDLFEGNDPKLRIERLWQEPPVGATLEAKEVLSNAHFIILGPGDLFTSIISNLIVGGIAEAITESRAKKIYICNVMTKAGETTDFQVSDHVREIVKYLKRDCLDYVLCSSTRFSRHALKVYAHKAQYPVIEKIPKKLKEISRAKVVFADVASESELVRHDSLKLAQEIKKIMKIGLNPVIDIPPF